MPVLSKLLFDCSRNVIEGLYIQINGLTPFESSGSLRGLDHADPGILVLIFARP